MKWSYITHHVCTSLNVKEEYLKSDFIIIHLLLSALNVSDVAASSRLHYILLFFAFSLLLCPSPMLHDIFNLDSLNLPSFSLVCRTKALRSVLRACRAITAVMRPLVRKLC